MRVILHPPIPAHCVFLWLLLLGSVYKEKALGDVDIDPVYLNGWVAVYQFLFSIPLLIPSAIASNVRCSRTSPFSASSAPLHALRGRSTALADCAFFAWRLVHTTLSHAHSKHKSLRIRKSRHVSSHPGANCVGIAPKSVAHSSGTWFYLSSSCPCCYVACHSQVSIPDLPSNLWNGVRCLAQADSVFSTQGPNGLQVRAVGCRPGIGLWGLQGTLKGPPFVPSAGSPSFALQAPPPFASPTEHRRLDLLSEAVGKGVLSPCRLPLC